MLQTNTLQETFFNIVWTVTLWAALSGWGKATTALLRADYPKWAAPIQGNPDALNHRATLPKCVDPEPDTAHRGNRKTTNASPKRTRWQLLHP